MLNDIIFLFSIISFLILMPLLVSKDVFPQKYNQVMHKWKTHPIIESGLIIWLGIILSVGFGVFAVLREEYFSPVSLLTVVLGIQLFYEESFRKSSPYRWFTFLRNSIFGGGVLLMVSSFVFIDENYALHNALSEIVSTIFFLCILIDVLVKYKYYRFRDE